ncbi:hypothetical protein TCON_0343 [Astathelohania contejeani]|uniref:Mediator of RNA polymerase II transcription subunit 18 n=1 Tax=Astathelohania contejeani TaxID=164912 RepID=A0ABQ7I230_9MICR|nr:hypothetical protein TCON_0343 [Thelohania contejeani]
MIECSLFGACKSVKRLEDYFVKQNYRKSEFEYQELIYKDEKSEYILQMTTPIKIVYKGSPDLNKTRIAVCRRIIECTLLNECSIETFFDILGMKKIKDSKICGIKFTKNDIAVEIVKKNKDENLFLIQASTIKNNIKEGEKRIEDFKLEINRMVALVKPQLSIFN